LVFIKEKYLFFNDFPTNLLKVFIQNKKEKHLNLIKQAFFLFPFKINSQNHPVVFFLFCSSHSYFCSKRKLFLKDDFLKSSLFFLKKPQVSSFF
jgi:hypothetical protein